MFVHFLRLVVSSSQRDLSSSMALSKREKNARFGRFPLGHFLPLNLDKFCACNNAMHVAQLVWP